MPRYAPCLGPLWISLSLLLLPGSASAQSEEDCNALLALAPGTTLVEAHWTRREEAGIAVYRSKHCRAALTQARYAFINRTASPQQRRHIAQAAIDLRRASELALHPRVELGSVQHRRNGEQLWSRYAGTDAATNRRFLNLSITDREGLLNFYLEAVELSPAQFERLSQAALPIPAAEPPAAACRHCGQAPVAEAGMHWIWPLDAVLGAVTGHIGLK